jgi:hypothetical protein
MTGQLYLRVNGSGGIPSGARFTAQDGAQVQSVLNLAAGDYVELLAVEAGGVTNSARGGSPVQVHTGFYCVRIGA